MTKTLLLVLILVAAGVTGLGLALPVDRVAQWMTHPARVMTSCASEAAEYLRLALLLGPMTVAGLVALIAWRSRRSHAVAAGSHYSPRRSIEVASGGTIATLILLVVAGFVLRIIRIEDSLWYDELAGVLGYSVHGPGVIVGNYFSQANHIFSQLLIWASASLFGTDEIAIRLPSLIAGIGLIPALWALGREARGDGFGLLAATAGAFLPLAISASTDARGYALVITLAALTTWLLLRAMRTHATWCWCLFALLHALMVWTHLAAVCVALGQGLVLVIVVVRGSDRRSAMTGLLALALAAVVTTCLYAPALPDLIALRQQFRAANGNEPTLIGPEGWHAVLGLGGSWTWWATLPGALLAIIGLRAVCTDTPLRTAFLFAFLGGPIAVLLAWAGDSWLYARFLLFLVPATALLVAAGLATLAAHGRLLVIVASAALGLTSTIEVLRSSPRQPLREAIERAAALRGDRPIGVSGLVDQVTLFYSEPARIPTFDLGSLGSRMTQALPRVHPNVVVVLYPDLVPAERREFLHSMGYRLHQRLDGWIDWGNGAVEVWTKTAEPSTLVVP